MKNNLLILLLAGSIAINIPSDAQLAAGLKGGMNYAGFSKHDGGKRISGHGGIFILTRFNAKWHMQSELCYSSEGQKYTFTEVVGETQQETERIVAVNFVSLPVMFQYFAARNFYMEAGPQLSFIISAKDKGPGNEKLNVKRSLTNTQFAFNAGMGLMTGNKTSFYVRYCMGLTDLTLFDDNADYSRVLQAGIFFRLSKKPGRKNQSYNR